MINWPRLIHALLIASGIFSATGLIVLGCILSVKYWFGPIILFSSLFIATVAFLYSIDLR